VLVLLPLLAVAYVRMQRLYRGVSREVRRLDSTTRSPLYASFAESMAGAVCIRAMGLAEALRARTRGILDKNQKIQFAELGLSQWLNIRLQAVGVSMITAVSVLSVVSSVYNSLSHTRGTSWLLNPSLVGLAIAYALPLTDTVNGLLSTATDTEKEVVSVERTVEYMEVRDEEEERQERAQQQSRQQRKVDASDEDEGEADEEPWVPWVASDDVADLEAPRSQSDRAANGTKKQKKVQHSSINEDLRESLLSSPVVSSVSPPAVHDPTRRRPKGASRPRSAAVPATPFLPPADWPSRGEVEFCNVTLRYRAGLEPALRGISVRVPPGRKVGIVGRTGSGKSSLTQALFGMYPLEAGRIEVDGIDLLTVNRSEWRRRVAIIPQTPVLFSGTIRSNLLPYDDDDDDDDGDETDRDHGVKHEAPRGSASASVSDAELWHVLSQCHMDARVRSLPQGLDTPLSDAMRLSVGERQCLAFARALLKKAQLLVLDEASASVDLVTDAVIQQLTLSLSCTVLLIAHRLSSVLSLDEVWLMEEGRIVERGPPQELAQQPGSAFARLLLQAQAQQGPH